MITCFMSINNRIIPTSKFVCEYSTCIVHPQPAIAG
jgi:hypothetical protein